jgi:hypothetical protein
MLHFLIGVAVCIWIVERVWRVLGPWREQRRQLRNLREGLRLARPWLSGEDIDKYVDDVYGRTPARSDTVTTVCLCVGFVVVMLAMAAFH